MRDWGVNAAGVAIAHEGEIALCKGYGKRSVEDDLPSTDRTLFPIASVTKSFTAMAVAMLVDEGLLDWDTPVREYMPFFRLHDAFAAERMTPRDLLTHRSGLPRHDFVRLGTEATREDLVRRLRYLAPAQDFRTVYQYQNLMYMTSGYLVQQVSGLTWEQFLQTRIFDRLGMVSTCLSTSVAERSGDHALPYRKGKKGTERIPFFDRGPHDPVGPAGAIVSSAADMNRWMLLHLNGGTHETERIISEAQLRTMHTPQTPIPDTGKWAAELPHNAYGMGWHIEPYRGYDMLHHGGNINGFSSMLAIMPQEQIGVVVLTNMGGTFLRDLLPYYVFDALLDLPAIDWNARFREDQEQMERGQKEGARKSKSDRVRRTKPSHPLEEYAGTYTDPGYGAITVRLEDGALQARYNTIDMPLAHYHYDVFEMTFPGWGYQTKVRFGTGVRGEIESLSAAMEPTIEDIVFRRAPEPALVEPDFLAQFAGEYELPSGRMSITHQDGVLEVSAPGLRDYEIVPYSRTEFAFKRLSGVSIAFELKDGVVTGAVLNQFGILLHAKKLD
jgi:CubicO group peptidase (beta-lactamase class C family)